MLRSKPSRAKSQGLLQPLPISKGRWKSVSMDFIVHLPKSEGFTAIFVAVYRFTKSSIFVPCEDSTTAVDLPKLFICHVVCEQGIPDVNISYRGPQFLSNFWKELTSSWGHHLKYSTAYHPQAGGQTERINLYLEQYLRTYRNYQQNDWVSLLPMAQYHYNSSYQASIKMTPFMALRGYTPSYQPNHHFKFNNLTPQKLASVILNLDVILTINLNTAIQTYKKYADMKKQPVKDIKEGLLVYLDIKNIWIE